MVNTWPLDRLLEWSHAKVGLERARFARMRERTAYRRIGLVTRLRTVAPSQPGIHRHRRGTWLHLHRPARVARSPIPLCCNGSRSSSSRPRGRTSGSASRRTGTSRRWAPTSPGGGQYMYHTAWREQRDKLKHDRILVVARRLPKARDRADLDLERPACRASARWRRRSGCWTSGFFRVGARATSRPTAATGWPRCCAGTSRWSGATWSSPTSPSPARSGG